MTIRQYLEHNLDLHRESNRKGISPRYPTLESFVLKEGEPFTSQALDESEIAKATALPWKDHRRKDCFRNAQSSLLTSCDFYSLKYVEGYVLPATPFPVLHAWLTMNGKVIDTTLRTNPEDDAQRVYGTFPKGWEYFGVELHLKQVLHVYEHHRTHISVLDDYLCHWPVITNHRPPRHERNTAHTTGVRPEP